MAAQAVTEPTGKEEGATTRAAKNGATVGGGAGAGVASAVVAIVIFVAAQLGLDLSEIETPLNVVASTVLGAYGARQLAGRAGANTPTDQVRVETRVVPVAEGGEAERLAAAQAAMAGEDYSAPSAAGSSAVGERPADPLEGLEPVVVPTVVEVPPRED